jgi:hypothetical protein
MTTAKTTRRIYIVKPKAGGPARLVRATHPSPALRHVAEADYTVAVANSEQLLECFEAGIRPEDIGQEQIPLT